MRISDWSSDVCSSDLCPRRAILIEIEFEMRHLQFLNGLPRGAPTLADARSRQRSNASGQRRPRRLPVQARQSAPQYGLLLAPHIAARRSEEHMSELQSLMRISYAVFCLKQKTNNT